MLVTISVQLDLDPEMQLDLDPEITLRLDNIDHKQEEILERTTKTMAAIDDLKAAVARDNASLSAELKAIGDKLSQPNPDTADIAAAAIAINGFSDLLDNQTAVLTGTPPVAGGPPAG